MDIREQAIHEYLVEGKTYRQLAKKYNVSRHCINRWILIHQGIHGLPRSKRQHSYDLQQMTRKKIPKPPLTPDAEEKIRQLEQQLTFEKLRAEGLDTMINIDFMPLQALRLLSVSSH
ncbi:MAG TPA: helix-turn-helix domain-containing protein [Chitinophagaceae bacterium]